MQSPASWSYHWSNLGANVLPKDTATEQDLNSQPLSHWTTCFTLWATVVVGFFSHRLLINNGPWCKTWF